MLRIFGTEDISFPSSELTALIILLMDIVLFLMCLFIWGSSHPIPLHLLSRVPCCGEQCLLLIWPEGLSFLILLLCLHKQPLCEAF